MSEVGAEFQARLEAVAARLEQAVRRPGSGLTAADPPTGERWDAGQVWAHLAEFIPYWIGEAGRVIENRADDPLPFGRTKTDPGRLAAIERDRTGDRVALWNRVGGDIAALHAFISGVPEPSWDDRGRHPTLGVMTVATLVDEFLVGHLEEHAEQLEQLTT